MIVRMKTNSDTTCALYRGLDVHKEQTVIAIQGNDRMDGVKAVWTVLHYGPKARV
jgi:hypothetical protein